MPLTHRMQPISLACAGGLLASAALLLLSGCSSKPITENVPPPPMTDWVAQSTYGDSAENSLDWDGTYQAVLPCKQCTGTGTGTGTGTATAMSVQLRQDYTAVVRERPLGSSRSEPATATTYSGTFRFDPKGGSLITLSAPAAGNPAYRFFVGEGWIELRDRTTGAALSPSPQQYRLRKTSDPAQ